jgi:type I restriction enzyme S subunit
MSDELPQGWAECNMGDVADVVGGGTPDSQDPECFSTGGGIPWLTPADLSDNRAIHVARGKRFLTKKGYDSSSARLVPRGTVLFSSRAPIGYVAVAANEISTNQGFKSFVCADGINPEYVYFWLRYATPMAEELASGTTFAEISGKNAAKIPLRLAPFAEQRRIVAKLEELLGRVGACQHRLAKIPALLKRFRQSVLAAACSGRLTADWRQENPNHVASSLVGEIRERRKKLWVEQRKARGFSAEPADCFEPAEPSNEFGFDVPESWEMCSMDALTTAITSGSRDWKQYYKDDGPGTFVMAQNVRPLRFDRSYRLAVAPPGNDRDRARSEVLKNDLLVTIVGANTGDSCRVPEELREHYVCQSVALMRPVLPETSRFLELYLNSSGHGLAEYKKWIYGEGRPHLSFDHLREMLVCLPPLPEQQEIVRRVESLFALADRIEARLAAAQRQAWPDEALRRRLDALTPSLLARAFAGKLVPQDPADEPATVLLERIKRRNPKAGQR